MFQVEGDEDGDGDDGHVGCEAEPGEECWKEMLVWWEMGWGLGMLTSFGGAVVPSVGVVVVEEEGREEGALGEGVAGEGVSSDHEH